MNVRLREAVERIREQSGGRMDIQVFPNSQLGGDTDMLSQLRTGAIQMFNLSGLILSTFVPLASINGIGFAFKDYDQVWTAMDGPLGTLIRAAVGNPASTPSPPCGTTATARSPAARIRSMRPTISRDSKSACR